MDLVKNIFLTVKVDYLSGSNLIIVTIQIEILKYPKAAIIIAKLW